MATGRSLSILIVATALASMSILLYRGSIENIVANYPWALNECNEPSIGAWAIIGVLLVVAAILLRGAWRLADPSTITPMMTLVVAVFVGIAFIVGIVGTIDSAKAIC